MEIRIHSEGDSLTYVHKKNNPWQFVIPSKSTNQSMCLLAYQPSWVL